MSLITARIDRSPDRVTITMACDDSGFSDDGGALPINQPKVLSKFFGLVGVVGSYRMLNILDVYLDMEAPHKTPNGAGDEMGWVISQFVPEVMGLVEAHKLEDDDWGTLLVAVGGRLFEVDASWAVTEPHFDFHAIGAGAQVALGVLWAGASVDRAIQATGRFHVQCGSLFGPPERRSWVLDDRGVAVEFDVDDGEDAPEAAVPADVVG